MLVLPHLIIHLNLLSMQPWVGINSVFQQELNIEFCFHQIIVSLLVRLLWTRLRVLQMYIDNVSPPGIQSNQSEREIMKGLAHVS